MGIEKNPRILYRTHEYVVVLSGGGFYVNINGKVVADLLLVDSIFLSLMCIKVVFFYDQRNLMHFQC